MVCLRPIPGTGKPARVTVPGVGARPLDPRLQCTGNIVILEILNYEIICFLSDADSTNINRRLRLFLIRKN